MERYRNTIVSHQSMGVSSNKAANLSTHPASLRASAYASPSSRKGSSPATCTTARYQELLKERCVCTYELVEDP